MRYVSGKAFSLFLLRPDLLGLDESDDFPDILAVLVGSSDEREVDEEAFVVLVLVVELVPVPDVALVVPDVLAVPDRESGVEERNELPHEIDETSGEPFELVGDGEMVAHDARGPQLLLAHGFGQEFVVGDDVELTGALPGVVLPEDADRKHADEDDLPLRRTDADDIPHAVLRHDEEECGDREPEVPEGDDDRPRRDREEVDPLVDGVNEHETETHEHRDNADHVDHLAFAVVFQVVLGVPRVGGPVVLREYRLLEPAFDAPRDGLDGQGHQNGHHDEPLRLEE